MRALVLASASPYRRALLERLGVPFEADDPQVDEIDHGLVQNRVIKNARLKVEASLARYPDAVVIGCDQLAEIDGRALGKPGSVEAAARQLEGVAGREHRLLTALTVMDGNDRREHLDLTRVRVRALSGPEISDYVSRDNPIDCCGAYKVEGLGIALFDYVRGEDPTAVIGLPLMAVTTLLKHFDIHVLRR